MPRYARARAPQLPPEIIDCLEPGLHGDGRGLYLRVDETGTRRWTFIYYMHGRRREMGLGGYRRVGLGTAREGAERARQAILAGLDPLANRTCCRRTKPSAISHHTNPSEVIEVQVDLDFPAFSQTEAAEWTAADRKWIDNYIQHGHLVPFREGGRRLFTARQLIQIELIARLGDHFRIPPSVATVIADEFSRHPSIESDARAVGDRGWVLRSSERAQATIIRKGELVEVAAGDDPEAIMIVVPVQMFSRGVLHHIRQAQADV